MKQKPQLVAIFNKLWVKPIAGATSKDYTITKAGRYNVKVDGSICPNNSGCPIYVEDFCECPPNICVPFFIQKTKTRTR